MSRRVHKDFRADQGGGSAVEFALVAPIFLLVILALFQVGIGIFAHASLARVAELGARHLLFAPDDQAGARAEILNNLGVAPIDPEKLEISMARLTTPYLHIEITLEYPYQPPGPVLLPEAMTLTSVARVPLAPG